MYNRNPSGVIGGLKSLSQFNLQAKWLLVGTLHYWISFDTTNNFLLKRDLVSSHNI